MLQEKDSKIALLDSYAYDKAPLESEKTDLLRQVTIKGFWKTGSESHDITVKCDRVELTGLLARKDYEMLLCTFLTAL